MVLCFINNNYEASTNRFGAFSLNATFGANNWFGLNPTGKYNIVDLLSTTPTNYIWSPNKAGSELINTGIVVILNGSPFEGKQAQFLKLVDVANALPDNDGDGIADLDDPDDDNDGLSDQWEQTYNLNPNIGTGTNGPSLDNDNDGLNNGDEQVAGTNPNDPNSVLEVADIDITNGQSRVQWDSVSNKNYRVQRAQQIDGVPTWQQVFFGTAFTTNELISDAATGTETARFYRVQVAP